MSNLTKAEFRKPGADVHLYIATPATTIAANFHMSLVREVPRILAAGHSLTYAHLAGHCHVDDARNLLTADFLASGATDLLFWDADVAAEPGAALKLLAHNVEVIGGAYPLKDGSGRFPARLIGLNGAHVPGLSEAESLPTGFLRIRRWVLLKLLENAVSVGMDGQLVPVIFERGVLVGDGVLERVGGDANFCRKVSSSGFKLYCDPSILFTHQGPVDFAGRLADSL